MAQINGIEVKNFNPNAKTYNECIKNTQAIQKEIDKRSYNSHLKLADSGAADENKNYKLAKQLEEIGLKEQRRVNALTKERKIWEKKQHKLQKVKRRNKRNLLMSKS